MLACLTVASPPVGGQPDGGGPLVAFEAGRVTIEARDAPLEDLLEALARQSGLRLSMPPGLEAARVTRSFQDLELPEAVDALLHGMSYALQYSPRSPGLRPSPNRLWVFSSGISGSDAADASLPGERSGEPRQTSRDAAAAERLEAVAALADRGAEPFAFALGSALVDESEPVRHEAVHALGQIGGEMSTRFLEQVLLELDPDMRTAAVDALAEIGGERSASALAPVLSDPDPAVRENAVYALRIIGGERARALLHEAVTDSDELVREAAYDVLGELEDED